MRDGDAVGTRDQLLLTAEQMFAQEGYQAVSLRAITRRCEVNPAAIHYHFGSKQAMLEEIFHRRCGPMNDERLRLLAECREAPDRPPLVEQILRAYLRPSLIRSDDPDGARNFLQLRAKLAYEDAALVQELIARHFDHVSRTFIRALLDALPDLPEEDVYWRVHFLHAAQYYTLINPGRIRDLSEGHCDPSSADVALDHMVEFFGAAFRMPSVSAATGARMDGAS